jgi:hypothetical protein
MVISNYLVHLDLYALYSTLRRNQYYRGGSLLVGGQQCGALGASCRYKLPRCSSGATCSPAEPNTFDSNSTVTIGANEM